MGFDSWILFFLVILTSLPHSSWRDVWLWCVYRALCKTLSEEGFSSRHADREGRLVVFRAYECLLLSHTRELCFAGGRRLFLKWIWGVSSKSFLSACHTTSPTPVAPVSGRSVLHTRLLAVVFDFWNTKASFFCLNAIFSGRGHS